MAEDVDLIKTFAKTIYRKWVLLLCALLGAVGAFFLADQMEPEFHSEAQFLQAKKQTGGNLSGLAALAGINMQSEGGGITDNLSALLTSPVFLDTILTLRWRTSVDTVPRTLREIYEIEAEYNPKAPHVTAEMHAQQKLQEVLNDMVSYQSKGDVKILTVKTKDPILSYEINSFLISYLDTYTNHTRKTNSRHQLRFLEEREADYAKELARAEEGLRLFKVRNRERSTPDLELAFRRLDRELTLNENIFNDLKQQIERTKIDIEKEIEVIDLFHPPTVPIWKTKPRKKLLTAGGFVFGFGLGMFLNFFSFWYRENRNSIAERLRV